jgi:hypothetical protein
MPEPMFSLMVLFTTVAVAPKSLRMPAFAW